MGIFGKLKDLVKGTGKVVETGAVAVGSKTADVSKDIGHGVKDVTEDIGHGVGIGNKDVYTKEQHGHWKPNVPQAKDESKFSQ